MRKKEVKRLFYNFIIFWPIIFCFNEIIGFPTVLLSLIFTMIGLIYLFSFDEKCALKILVALGLAFSVQSIILISNFNFDNDIESLSSFLKFFIRLSNLIVYLYIISKNKNMDFLKKYFAINHKKIIKTTSIVLMIEIISLVFNKSYELVWEGRYFKSIFYSPHVNSYFLIALLVFFILLYEYTKNKKMIIISIIICVYLNLITGARTTAVVALGIFAFFVISLLSVNKKSIKKFFCYVLIALFINVCFSIIDIREIPLVKKFVMVMNDPSGFLNGRNYIWGNMTKYVKDCFYIINYIFGIGMSQSMKINYMYIQQALWAHNDFIEIFIGGGLFLLGIYFKVIKDYIKNTREYLFIFLILFIMFFNGLFLYTELVIAIPIITIVGSKLNYRLKSNIRGKKNERNNISGRIRN